MLSVLYLYYIYFHFCFNLGNRDNLGYRCRSCNTECIIFKSKSKHFGRLFYGCPNSSANGCNFWQIWVDNVRTADQATSSASVSSNVNLSEKRNLFDEDQNSSFQSSSCFQSSSYICENEIDLENEFVNECDVKTVSKIQNLFKKPSLQVFLSSPSSRHYKVPMKNLVR